MCFRDFMSYYKAIDEYAEYMSLATMGTLGEFSFRSEMAEDFYSKYLAFHSFIPPRRFCGYHARTAVDIEDMMRAEEEDMMVKATTASPDHTKADKSSQPFSCR